MYLPLDVQRGIHMDDMDFVSQKFKMSSFGTLFKITTFGESHCKAVGVIVEGVPPGLAISEGDIQSQLSRRRPGQSNLTTPRDEKDSVTILSGTEMGICLGTPVALMVWNQDQRPHDYGEMDLYPRPSHADYTYLEKYGVKASSGGGRSSARETIGRVAAGALAEKYLTLSHGIEIVAFVGSVGHVSIEPTHEYQSKGMLDEERWLQEWHEWWDFLNRVNRKDVDSNEVRCPDIHVAEQMRQRILAAKQDQDSIGGTVICVIRNLPMGLGEPCFDKFEAQLAHAMLSIPATKGFEIGSGFSGTKVPGHLHNDAFVHKPNGKLGTKTNFSGGIQGGITNGENVYFKVSFKPPATIGQSQPTATYNGQEGVLEAKGRHDPCVVPRAVPIVEAMASLVVMDCLLQQNARLKSLQSLDRDSIPPVLKGELFKS